ncbi:MAG TPA: hypothetical protein VKB46_19415 [Pyrinomonadaceae bacterium]|nr:hypothetical protein [Pyrinomonadaceae bacterium]
MVKPSPGLLLFVIGSSLLVFGQAQKQAKRPVIYVDKGACPFECCVYRRWRTEKATVAYAQPDRNAKVVGKFKAGSRVVGLTGEVRTTGGKFVIKKTHEKYKPGDVLWVYTTLGEGLYKVWFNGKMYEEKLDYMSGPFEQSIPKCEDAPDCWGQLEQPLKSIWWVKIRSAEGWVGWTDEPDNFGNKDACG